NAGTIVHAGLGALSLNGAATTLDTVVGGIYDLQSNSQVNCVGTTGVFKSEGIFRRSVSTGVAMLASNFVLAGAVVVQIGQLTLFPNGMSGTVSGAVLNVTPSATLDMTGGTNVTYTGAVSSTGGGKLLLNSGTVLVPTNASFSFTDP